MQGVLIAALLFAPPGNADAFCEGLKRIVDAGPGGFAGVPLTLPNPLDPGTPFDCEIDPGRMGDALQDEHVDFICEARKPSTPDRDAKLASEADALEDRIGKCALPLAMAAGRDGPIATPNTVIDVGLTFLNDERVTPAAETSGLRITIHAIRSGANTARL